MQVKYVQYGTEYDLLVRSCNDVYKSDFAKERVRTSHPRQAQFKPQLVETTSTSLKFKLPAPNLRLSSSELVVIVQDYNKDLDLQTYAVSEVITGMNWNSTLLCHDYGETWVALIVTVKTKQKLGAVVV